MLYNSPVIFPSGNTPLVGYFIRNTDDVTTKQPTVIVTGSWLTVKEQMPKTYAEKLAELGYAAFIFDFSGFGQSSGEPKQAEIPARKIKDIIAAVNFLSTISFVDPNTIGILSICASAQYTLAAIARGAQIKSFASVAGWFHDAPSIAHFYGGAEGVEKRLAYAKRAVEKFAITGEVDLVPAYEPGNDLAGMSFQVDYYGNSNRGAISEWKNEMATMSWFHWLTFDGLRAASEVTIPTLFVHGDGCVLPDHVKQIYAAIQGDKDLLWTEGNQVDFYDQPPLVNKAVSAAHRHFQKTLNLG
ncbi:MAG: dienelactone hydrolase family protein [Cyanobacteria bacterium P01_D01_bin.56]